MRDMGVFLEKIHFLHKWHVFAFATETNRDSHLPSPKKYEADLPYQTLKNLVM